MQLVVIAKPNDRLYTEVLQRICRFALELPGSTVPVAWYALRAAQGYFQGDLGVLLLAAVDEDGHVLAHCLGVVEDMHGRRMGWCYQAEVNKGVPQGQRYRIIRGGLRILEAWATANNCVALGLATPHPPRTMGRLFGFVKTVQLMERPLGGQR